MFSKFSHSLLKSRLWEEGRLKPPLRFPVVFSFIVVIALWFASCCLCSKQVSSWLRRLCVCVYACIDRQLPIHNLRLKKNQKTSYRINPLSETKEVAQITAWMYRGFHVLLGYQSLILKSFSSCSRWLFYKGMGFELQMDSLWGAVGIK